MFLLILILAQPIQACGTFDLEQLNADLKNGYFDHAGVEMAKAVIIRLELQLECERKAADKERTK